jgi:hypothetical protein
MPSLAFGVRLSWFEFSVRLPGYQACGVDNSASLTDNAWWGVLIKNSFPYQHAKVMIEYRNQQQEAVDEQPRETFCATGRGNANRAGNNVFYA